MGKKLSTANIAVSLYKGELIHMKKRMCLGAILLLLLLTSCQSEPTNQTYTSDPQVDESNENVSSDYEEALNKIEDAQYDAAKEILAGIGDYKLSSLLLANMDKLEALIENTWTYSAYGWNYSDTFSVSVSGETITLYNREDEYSDNLSLGYYLDPIDLEDLLDDGVADVSCQERDDFTIDINDVLEGSFRRYHQYLDAVYTLSEITGTIDSALKNTEIGNNSTKSATIGERNALQSAKDYLNYLGGFSYEGLVEQLEFEGYTHSEAVYAADNCGADWNEQAVIAARQYLNALSFSRQGLIEQLEFEGFTHSQAVYGVEQNGY